MASALEIIARSITDHPTLFRASLVSQAETHDDYAGQTMKRGGAYYAGGARVVIDGIPLRVARKPGATYTRWLKERERLSDYYTPRERAQQRATEANKANKAIEIYADMLEISIVQAKARITAQRNHLIANPLIDLSLEYDL